MNPALLAQLLRQAQGGANPMMAQPNAPEAPLRLPTMRSEDPDFLPNLMEPLNSEEAQFQRQLQQAQALMQGGGYKASTPTGAALTGIADMIRAWGGANKAESAEAGLRANAAKQKDLVARFGNGPSASAVSRNEAATGRTFQELMQGRQQDFQHGQQQNALDAQAKEGAKDRSLKRTLAEMELAGKKEAAKTKAKDDIAQAEAGLRKEIMGNQIVKDLQQSIVARDGLIFAAKDPTPAGDLAMVFATMQALDPGSVVKEGEQIQVRNATNLPDRVLNYFSRVQSGQQLTPQQRNELIAMANNQVAAREGVVRKIYSGYEPAIQAGGLNRANVFPFALGAAPMPYQAAAAPQAAPAQPPTSGPVVGPGDPRNIKQSVDMDGKRYTLRGDGSWYLED